MITRLYLLILSLGLCAGIARAQTDSVFYFNKNAVIVTNHDSAAYYRVINSRKGDVFTFTEYRKDGMTVKALARGTIERPIYNDYVNLYYKNGKPAEMHEYSNGVITKTLRYHTNGTLIQTLLYRQEDGWPTMRILYEADSTGKPNIEKGNGTRKESGTVNMVSLSENYTVEGSYKLGAKDGTWKGSNDKGTTFEEVYDRGKLMSGTSKSADGKKYTYKKTLEYPEYKAGRASFERIVREHLKHPEDTLNLGTKWPHQLLLNYTIDKKGRPVAIRAYNPNTKTETYLDLKYGIPDWSPATIRGVPVEYFVNWNAYVPLNKLNLVPLTAPVGVKLPFNTDIYIKGNYPSQ
jgi:hypothetical protein